jgi:hypothetical protein
MSKVVKQGGGTNITFSGEETVILRRALEKYRSDMADAYYPTNTPGYAAIMFIVGLENQMKELDND